MLRNVCANNQRTYQFHVDWSWFVEELMPVVGWHLGLYTRAVFTAAAKRKNERVTVYYIKLLSILLLLLFLLLLLSLFHFVLRPEEWPTSTYEKRPQNSQADDASLQIIPAQQASLNALCGMPSSRHRRLPSASFYLFLSYTQLR